MGKQTLRGTSACAKLSEEVETGKLDSVTKDVGSSMRTRRSEQVTARSPKAALPWSVQGGFGFIYDHAMSTSSRPECKLANLEVERR